MPETGLKHIFRLAESGTQRRRGHTFVLKCEACAALFILRRPRRILGWLPLPPDHGPGRPCLGSFRILHHDERLDVLRSRGLR